MLKLGLLLLVLPGMLLMGAYLYDLSLVEACLDSGGSWDYIEVRCDTERQHPFVPYMARHPLLVNGGMLLSVLGLLLCIAGLYRRR
jgi:hypothetical protein